MTDARYALSRFGMNLIDAKVSPLGNAGGMSGARLWKCTTKSETHCLRRWPREHPTIERLTWIHQQLRKAAEAGCSFIPSPLVTRDDVTYVDDSRHLWELTLWLPGQADFHQRPSALRLGAAMRALAQFHNATSESEAVDVSPGLQDRWQHVQRMTATHLDSLSRAIDDSYGQETATLSRRFLAAVAPCLIHAERALDAVRNRPTRLQTCIRDVWHDHVLFSEDQVTGIVDFGAMRIDTPAGDIARLMGSLVRDDRVQWRFGLEAYRDVRNLSADDVELLAAFDVSNVALSGLNWIRWLYVERRRFEERDRIISRLAELSYRADGLARQGWPRPTEL